MVKIKRILFLILFFCLVYTRFVNLEWGLPYPFHPDERNMANVIQELNCDIRYSKSDIHNCFNPHFFAYGQFPLYLGYGIIQFNHLITGHTDHPISFEEAVMSLRFISALASVLNALVLIKLINLLIDSSSIFVQTSNNNKKLIILLSFLVIIFSPFFIQFSHFGTTESLLMLYYSLIIYLSLLFIQKKIPALPAGRPNSRFLILNSIVCGLAVAAKVSSVIFLAVPLLTLGFYPDQSIWKDKIKNIFLNGVWLVTLTLVFSIIFSPHNFISFQEFLGSIRYESDVGIGRYLPFYTRQFVQAIPVLFQSVKIFPYTLGLSVLIFFILGFFTLPFRKEINLLRLAFLIYFIPNAFFYAKWTRFIAPIFPVMLIISILSFFSLISLLNIELNKFRIKNLELRIKVKSLKFINFVILFMCFVLFILFLIPGIAFLSIYQSEDVRFKASEWIYKNIPANSFILSETANVVDLPIPNPNNTYPLPFTNFKYISFNFYDLDSDVNLQSDLKNYLAKADYIFLPSRRIFMNQYCRNNQFPISNNQIIYNNINNIAYENNRCELLNKKYPLLNQYYDKLFSGQLGFIQVTKFSSYPKISLFGKTLIEFPDEQAEETWTVFDHPVIRIYEKIMNY